ncbi:MAG: alginate lyase family protein [Bauldia sp.]|nr:alginate lyase family protein [Bauldia sp.]
MGSALEFARTGKHLRAVQILARVRKHFVPAVVDGRPAPEPRSAAGRWTSAVCRDPALLAASVLRFLNRSRAVDQAAWMDATEDRLWLYNLHYFDDLNARDGRERAPWHRALVDRWLAEVPAGRGVGWEPYPVSLRLVNWIKWSLSGEALKPAWSDSLAVQARWLERRIEYHLLGNHLIANAKALVFSGAFFSGAEADRWRLRGLRLMTRELNEQVLPDGGHFERSPMYHSIVLEDVLDLVNLACAYPGVATESEVGLWADKATRMRSWLSAMTHPDGRIAFFNDAAFGIAADPHAIEAYAQRLGMPAAEIPGQGLRLLSESGYAVLRIGEGTAFLDVAPVGPDYQPGHAHADTLSFELSVGAERVVVNGGTSEYGDTPQRHHERSTAAHSTVEIDGENSSEVWSSFRVARRARPFDLRVEESPGLIEVECAHDGYRRLRGKPVHRRRWRMTGAALEIADVVEGKARTAIARFHLAPGVEISSSSALDGGSAMELLTPLGRRIRFETSSPARVDQSAWHPEFGVSVDTRCISVPIPERTVATRISW